MWSENPCVYAQHQARTTRDGVEDPGRGRGLASLWQTLVTGTTGPGLWTEGCYANRGLRLPQSLCVSHHSLLWCAWRSLVT